MLVQTNVFPQDPPFLGSKNSYAFEDLREFCLRAQIGLPKIHELLPRRGEILLCCDDSHQAADRQPILNDQYAADEIHQQRGELTKKIHEKIDPKFDAVIATTGAEDSTGQV